MAYCSFSPISCFALVTKTILLLRPADGHSEHLHLTNSLTLKKRDILLLLIPSQDLLLSLYFLLRHPYFPMAKVPKTSKIEAEGICAIAIRQLESRYMKCKPFFLYLSICLAEIFYKQISNLSCPRWALDRYSFYTALMTYNCLYFFITSNNCYWVSCCAKSHYLLIYCCRTGLLFGVSQIIQCY